MVRDASHFIEDALSPARVMSVNIIAEPNSETGDRGHAVVEVANDQQSLAIGRGGQNVRLAAKLTGWKIDIISAQSGEALAEANESGDTVVEAPVTEPAGLEVDDLEAEDGMTSEPLGIDEDEATSDRNAVNPNDDEMEEVDTPEEAEALMNEEEKAA
jgi:transcription antitermination factor NusA-like protein